LYIGYSNGKISRVNLDNTNDYQIFWYNTPPTGNTYVNGIVGYENELYFSLSGNGIYKCSSSGSSAGNTTLVIGITDPAYGMAIQWPYLFYSPYSLSQLDLRYVNLTNYFDYGVYARFPETNNTGMVAYNNKLYSAAYLVNNVTVFNLPVNVQTTPVSFNSYTVTNTISGNIDISITDSNNSIYNLVKYSYYLYSSGTNNSNVLSAYTHSGLTRYDGNTTTYAFRVSNLTVNQYSVYLIGNNKVGNTAPVMSNVFVYTTPLPYSKYSASCTSSGNLTISLLDTVNSYVNNISYMCYLFGPLPNNAGNISYYTRLVGNLTSASTTTQGTLTGLTADTYFPYIVAKNAVGNSPFITQITTTYTTVPSNGFGATLWNGNMYVAMTTGNIYRVGLTSTTNNSTNWASGQTGNYGVAAYNGYIYSVGLSNNKVSRININNPSTDNSSNFIDWSANTNLSGRNAYSAYAHKNYLYIGYDNGKISRVNMDNTNDYQIFWYDTPPTGNVITGIVGYENELYFALNGNGIYKCSSSGSSAGNATFIVGVNNDAVYGMAIQWPYLFYSLHNTHYIRYVHLMNTGLVQNYYAIPIGVINKDTGMVAYNNKLYSVAINTSNVSEINLPVNVQTTPVSFNSYAVSSTTSGNIDINITDSSNNVYNLVGYSYYLYSSGTNNPNVVSAYTHSGLTRYDYSKPSNFSFRISNLASGQYSVYLIGNNTVGNTAPVMSNVIVYTTPFTPTIVSTSSTSAGSLVVNISDTVNSSTNQVYYQYSTDGIRYGNTDVLKSSGNTYSFTVTNTGNASILLTDVRYTLFVRTINPVAFSSAVSTSAIVYQTPRTPSAFSSVSNESGNISVTITETSPPAFYYLNNVYYYYYLYNGTGQNQSGNSLAYTNSLVALSSASNTTQFKIQGQAANNYTVYVIAKNTVGNSAPPATGNYVTVQTTPVSFNSFTAVNNTSGNIDLTINDSSNNIYNSVNYFYYLYVSGTNESGNNSLYTDTGITKNASGNTYTYQIPNLSANQYTVYLLVKNIVGNSQPLTQTVNVYTTPVPPTIVSTNSTVAGNLTINLFDDQNSATNQVYYYYSLNGTTGYGNSNTLKTSGYTYSFTIKYTGNTNVLLTDISYTLFVQSKNSVGDSSPVSQLAIVYQIPNTPSVLSVTSTELGNVDVTVTETNPPALYYLNNVYYYYYLYNGAGQNQSGNNLAYTSSLAAFTSASNTTSFKIQGQAANTYTLYIRARNTVGD
jgi:uncharacterized protein YaaQ